MEQLASMSENPTNRELLAQCRAGDRGAMQALYIENQRRVFSIAFNFFGGDAAKAEDVTQQVFVKLLRKMDFRGESQFTTWLYRLTVNQCIDEARRSRRWLPFADWFEVAEPITRISLNEKLRSSEISAEVRAVIGGLKPKYRLPILLRYVEELSYQEIASVLGLSLGTVSSRLNRGQKMLAERLGHLRSELQ